MRDTAYRSQASEDHRCIGPKPPSLSEDLESPDGTPPETMKGILRGRDLFGAVDRQEEHEGLSSPLRAIGPGALHEIGCPRAGDWGTAAAFALAFLRVAQPNDLSQTDGKRPLLWIQQDMAEREAGRPCARGLAQVGLAPPLMVLARARTARDVLWAMEEGLRCGTLAAVIGEVHGDHAAFDFTASRRLSLAAHDTGVPAFLLRPAPKAESFSQAGSAAASRWLVAAAASLRERGDVRAPGLPRADLSLLKARGHMPARWTLALRELGGGTHHERERLDGPALPRTAHPVPEADLLAGGSVARDTGPARPRRRVA